MLEVQALSRRYGATLAVDDVSFKIRKGEVVGLLGHNGAGKTTIMKMLSGYLEPNQGGIKIGGLDQALKPQETQQALGYLPENLPLYPEMTVANYLDYAADLKRLRGAEKQRELRRVVAATELKSKLAAQIATLSRGFKQRVGVAQAILGQPKLLILDEPTNGLDPQQTQQMRELILDIAQQATVILSTHIMQEVTAVCSRVLILNAGKLVIDEQLESLQHSDQLRIDSSLPRQNMGVLKALDSVQSVQCLTESNGVTSYRVTLKSDTAENPSARQRQGLAELASTLVNGGHQLYRLTAETRDLERLFAEVNADQTQKGGRHAA